MASVFVLSALMVLVSSLLQDVKDIAATMERTVLIFMIDFITVFLFFV
jgi:hypothetical protein